MLQRQLPFLRNKKLLEAIDIVARRYGKLPSELLRNSIGDWSFDLTVATNGQKAELAAMKKR